MNPTVTDATARTPGTSPVGAPQATTADTGETGSGRGGAPQAAPAAPGEPAGRGGSRPRRQDAPDKPGTARWEEFAVPYRPNMNVISCPQSTPAPPGPADGNRTPPPVWDS